jgi:eukaryotic-like serine/threonine-protein kinase
MSKSHVCPECGNGMPADAPDGLCPKCLLGAAVFESQASFTNGIGQATEDRPTDFRPSPLEQETSAPAAPVELAQFKRAVLELGLIPAVEFERFISGALGGVQGLARALVVAGKLTSYQAAALVQGKARGLVIGNYFILDKLGAGGMGVVFKARHRRLGRIVALKILPPSLARGKDLLLRFRREVDVAARLSHPNIVSVLDANEDRGVQFMTMEFIQGNDLDRLVRDGGALPVDQALDCVIQAARGLEAAHSQGIVHRDIKPGNLMVDEAGIVRVLDLGLARLVEAANPFGETTPGPLTQSGTYMGTVDFMAPEQGVDSRRVDHRADIYSLGCTLCYLLTGRAPFDGSNVLARLVAHQERPPASLCAVRPNVPKSIDAVYQKMMAKKPADRPTSMTEVITLLETCRSPSAPAEEVRSGLKTFAQSVILKRATPRATMSDSPVFKGDEHIVLSLGPQPKREDILFDHQEPNRPSAPAASEPSPLPLRRAPNQPRPSQKSRAPALTLAALALLVMAGLATYLITRTRPGPGEKRSAAIKIDKPAEGARADTASEHLTTGVTPVPNTINSIGMKLALIPAGEFVMGAHALEVDADKWEAPRHGVKISRPFYLGVTEVTQGQYRAVTGKNPSKFSGSDDLPVECVGWYDAVAYCNALSAKEGRPPFYRIEGRSVLVFEGNDAGYRLPTEAEWEYACRAGTTGRFHFGSDAGDLDLYAWYRGDSYDSSHPVGEKRANDFGLFDMHGNVWEWCADWFGGSYYRESPAIDPPGPSRGDRRVYRGGSWNHDPRLCRATTRHTMPPDTRDNRLGFRVALTRFAR